MPRYRSPSDGQPGRSNKQAQVSDGILRIGVFGFLGCLLVVIAYSNRRVYWMHCSIAYTAVHPVCCLGPAQALYVHAYRACAGPVFAYIGGAGPVHRVFPLCTGPAPLYAYTPLIQGIYRACTYVQALYIPCICLCTVHIPLIQAIYRYMPT